MSNASNALEELIGNHLLRTATWSKPSGIYVGVTLGNPAPGFSVGALTITFA